MSSVSGKVSQLASYETFRNNPNYIQEELKRIQAVTKEDVMRVYNQYIKGKNSVILSVVPKGKTDLLAKADNYTISKEGFTPAADEYSGLKYTKAVDTFDRSKRPSAGANPIINVPNYYTNKFKNGLKVIGAKSDEVPTVTLQLIIQGGHRLSANDPGKAGISALTADMMNEDTKRLFNPKFTKEDFDRLKKQQLEGIANQATQPTAIANKVYNKLLYGDNNIMAIPTSGTTETVEKITLQDVQNFYEKNYSPSVSSLVVVGDISEKEIMNKLAFLKNWKKKDVKIPADIKAPSIEKSRIYFVDKPDAAQSEIRIGYLSMPFDATGEYYKAGLMNYALGGAFNSRINLNLREDKGYTYGARSYFGGSKFAGPFTASAGVRADASAESVTEFMKELTNFKTEGISEDEVKFMKSSIGQSDARKYETPYQKAGFLGRIIDYNLNKDFVKKQTDILNNITKKDIDALAAKNLPVENMHIVVVGDKKNVLPKLEAMPYEVIELDTDGNPIGSSSVK